MGVGSVISRGSKKLASAAIKSGKVGVRGVKYVAPVVAGAGGAALSSFSSERRANSDPGFVLFIMGFLSFFIIEFIDNFWFALVIGTFFMFYSALTVFEKKGIVTVSLFFVWYIFLGGRFDIGLIKYYGIPLIVLGMFIHGLVKKSSKSGNFSEGLVGELTGAALPIILFVLDLGLIDLLTNTFRISLNFINVGFLTFVPWWGMLGLMTTKKDATWVTLLKVLMLFYVIILVFVGVVPGAYGQYQESLITGPQELFQAKLDARNNVKAENPLTSYGVCLITGRLTELDICVQEKQRKSLAESTCKSIGFESDIDFNQCVKDELEILEKGNEKGSIDSQQTEFLEAEFKSVDSSFPKIAFESKKSYPSTLIIKNPLQQNLVINLECNFEKGSLKIKGEITVNGANSATYSTNLKNDPLNIICKPTENLDGRYTFSVKATLENVATTSSLTRVFVKNQKDKERWESEIRTTALSGFDAGLSKSPAEFARLNFGFGNFPEDPIVVANKPVVLTTSIEDIGKGQISKIKTYLLSDLNKKGFYVTGGDENCLERGEVIFPKKVKNYHLAECFIQLPTEYQQFQEKFIVETFEAQLVYDYTLEQKVPGIKIDSPEEESE